MKLYHATKKENSKSIINNNFSMDVPEWGGRQGGDGYYFSSTYSQAEYWAHKLFGQEPDILEVEFTGKLFDYNGDTEPLKDFGLKANLIAPLEQGGYEPINSLLDWYKKNKVLSFGSEWVNQLLCLYAKDNGYDGVNLIDHEVIVFHNSKISNIKITGGSR